ncbi:MAG: DUF308 domain-containing protein [Candidatus Dormibacteraeota bacterium]|jgi:uncharacterized membrane protein HdeD (DUF308 family)|nr:DUF308 domain-containing protein [Candidatus Dormibacteraeota bacterium]
MSTDTLAAPAGWNPIAREIIDRWWLLALRGVASSLLGIAAFVVPGITLLVLVILFGAYLLIDGVLAIVAGAMGRSWLLVLEGAAGVIAGLLTLVWPGITAVVLLILTAAWAIVTGVAELVAAYRLRRIVRNEWLLILLGVASIMFGIALVIRPGAGLLALVYLIGAYCLLFGVLLVALALRLRSISTRGGVLPT